MRIYKFISSISNNLYLEKGPEISKRYNNTTHRISKMRYLGPETDIDLNVEINTKTESKFKGFNREWIPESETIFSKIYEKNGQQKYLKFKTLKIQTHGHMT